MHFGTKQYLVYPTFCYNGIWVFPNIRISPKPPTLPIFRPFHHSTLIVTSVINLVWALHIFHTEKPTLFTTGSSWHTASCGPSVWYGAMWCWQPKHKLQKAKIFWNTRVLFLQQTIFLLFAYQALCTWCQVTICPLGHHTVHSPWQVSPQVPSSKVYQRMCSPD